MRMRKMALWKFLVDKVSLDPVNPAINPYPAPFNLRLEVSDEFVRLIKTPFFAS